MPIVSVQEALDFKPPNREASRSRLRKRKQEGTTPARRVSAASDGAGAQAILGGIRKRWPRVKHLFADGGHR